MASNVLWKALMRLLVLVFPILLVAQTGTQPIPESLTRIHVRALIVDPADPRTLYAGTKERGAFRSADGGRTWEPFGESLGVRSVTALAFSTADARTILAATEEGVFSSRDRGISWQAVRRYGCRVCEAIAVAPSDPSIYYPISFPAGDTALVTEVNRRIDLYPPTGFPPIHVYDFLFDPRDARVRTAATSVGIFRSDDGSATWHSPASGFPAARTYALASPAGQPDIVYALTDLRIFRSDDRGEHWVATPGTRPPALVESLAVDAGDTVRLYAGTDRGVYKSEDGGVNWLPMNAGLLVPAIRALAVDPKAPGTVFAGTDGWGAFKSEDGGSHWTAIRNGLGDDTVNTLAVHPSANTIYAGTGADWKSGDGVYRSLDGGTTWAPMNEGILKPKGIKGLYAEDIYSLQVESLKLAPGNSARLYATVGGDLFDNADGGKWRRPLNLRRLYDAGAQGIDQAVWALDVANSHVMYLGGAQDLVKTTDDGRHWSPVHLGLGEGYVVDKIVLDPARPGSIFAAAKRSVGEGRRGILLRSLDSGMTWSEAAGLPDASISSLVVDPAHAGTLYAGTMGAGVVKSSDGGATWTSVNNGLSAKVIFTIAVDPAQGSTVYAGTVQGVFKSVDGGQHWTSANAGLGPLEATQ